MIAGLKSIRPFIGALNFEVSCNFYRAIGFKQIILSPAMSLFTLEGYSFYLQDSYVDDWVNNTMLFLEVEDVQKIYHKLFDIDLLKTFPGTKLKPIVQKDWGSEFFLHDPSNILWHIGSFTKINE